MLSILRKARLKDKEMRILMLGLDNAGKTTIVKRLMNEDVDTVSPTLGFIIRTIDYEGQVIPARHGCMVHSSRKSDDIVADTSSTSVRPSRYPTCANLLIGDGGAGDVGGQKTLRTYWRNYFEKTDALIWVVDAADRLRVHDCRKELAGLLLEEVCVQRLAEGSD
ncbi:MAG: hypothetical protein Q9185_004301 [Variospora sp. 1 TL-2023]